MAIIIKSEREGFWRAGVRHSRTPITYPDGHFTKEQMELLIAEPKLTVDVVEEPEEVKKKPAPTGDAAKMELLLWAIANMPSKEEEPGAWTSEGKPQVATLGEILGETVKGDERDQAWAKHQEHK